MDETADKAIAIVGVGAVLPDAPDASTFWSHVTSGRYCISEVPADRWEAARYYNADPKAPDKTYSVIGGWCRDYPWDPMAWKMPLPPRVADLMDRGQKWSVVTTREALADYGYPQRPLDPERTAVIFGVAMGGDQQLLTAARALFPEVTAALEHSPSFSALPEQTRMALLEELRVGVGRRLPPITEDAMPGELANIVAGRVAALFDFRGPNFTTDAACASALAAIGAAIKGLLAHEYDAVVTGGSDANMSASTFVKFCKIGALSPTGSRPYAEGADGFVMGEGAAAFVLKRLADAERDGDQIYGVIRGVGASSDGKGKGITAPNPAGQKLAIQRAWQSAGLPMQSVTLVEGHGTSTPVGDAVELQVLHDLYGASGLPSGGIALGSVKSNIGHLKGGAGAAGMLKMALALRHKVLPPSLNFQRPNPKIDFNASPFRVNTELREWDRTVDGVRRGAVSAFGFGGTNFHVVVEEHVPGRLTGGQRTSVVSGGVASGANGDGSMAAKAPLRGALVLGGTTTAELTQGLEEVIREAQAGLAPKVAPPAQRDLLAPERLAIDYADAGDLATKAQRALKALQADNPAMWRALSAQGVFRGRGAAPKVAFLYPGQGSQYLNMLGDLRHREPIVAQVFREADEVMTPILEGRSLSEYVFVGPQDEEATKRADNDLRQTAITQPAVLAADAALTRMLAAYGIEPDMVMGHSLGEYGALTAAGALPLGDALEAVSARGREMERVSVEDNGLMMAVFGPMEEIQRTIDEVDGYAVVANINSNGQAVVGGTTEAIGLAMTLFEQRELKAVLLPVSHAFHTKIVAPASDPLREVLMRLRLSSPRLPLVANVTGDFYPVGGADAKAEMADILGQQVASPVQFVKGLETLYDAGARVFVEVGPKKALHGFVLDVLGDRPDVVALFTNHPKIGDTASFNQALCGLYAAGLGQADLGHADLGMGLAAPQPAVSDLASPTHVAVGGLAKEVSTLSTKAQSPAGYGRTVGMSGTAQSGDSAGGLVQTAAGNLGAASTEQLGRLFAEFLQRGMELYGGQGGAAPSVSVVVTGASMGLPGTERVFDDSNLERVLSGQQFIKSVPVAMRQKMLDKNIVRLVKDQGGARFERIDRIDEVIKIAGRSGELDLAGDFGFPADRLPALDKVTQLAMAAGLEAMRDAGLPLVMRYKTTSTGSQLPDRWMLPEGLRDDTGVIFASSFPGYDALISDVSHYHLDKARRERLSELEELRARAVRAGRDQSLVGDLDGRIAEVRGEIERDGYTFDRRFIFKVLAMGHSQLAEYIGARGPNTHVNAACASSTHAVSVAEDWIRAGRCRRVVIISGDDVTSDAMMEWFGPGFLSTGAAATDEKVEDAAIPFDRRRHGLVLGMGAAAMVVESADAAAERGLRPICEVISTVTSNSAFHGTRLDVQHISSLMQTLVSQAEQRHGINRNEVASQLLFVSHETFTPARGGSAQAEVQALRDTFGAAAGQIVVANTKGLTGHAMGVGIEDVVAIKALETGVVPPVANFKEPDPELGLLNLSRGGAYPLRYALRLGAGFGSQIALTLMRWIPSPDGQRTAVRDLGFQSRVEDAPRWQKWLSTVSGYDVPQVERAARLLRVADQGAPVVSLGVAPVVAPGFARASVGVPAQVPLTATYAAVPAIPLAGPPQAADSAVPQGVTASEPSPTLLGEVRDPVEERVLAIVSEETGYPAEMLDPDLDLEADLGIDTVKQAEVFASVRDTYAIARDDGLDLRAFSTLRSVVQWVYQRRPDLNVATAPTVATSGAVTPAAPVASAASPAAAIDPVQAKVLEIVSEETGYPAEMLDPDLDLEADLGIDTVKQAEVFASVRETYAIARDDGLDLRAFSTLRSVVQWVYDRRPDLNLPPVQMPVQVSVAADAPAPSVGAVSTVSRSAPAAEVVDPVQAKVLEIVSEETGYPAEMLEPDLDLEADLGIDTVKQAEVFASVRETYAIARDDGLDLRAFSTLRSVVQWVYDRRPDLNVAPDQLPAQVSATGDAAAPAAATATSAAPAAEVSDPVQAKVLEIVSEETGYPAEMLEPDLDLEADLGIDTVKQAEVFASVRETYSIPRDDGLDLREFSTLRSVVQWVYDRCPDLQVAAGAVGETPAVAADATEQAAAQGGAVLLAGSLEAANRVPRRIPTPVVRPSLSVCRSTGVELGAGSRVIVKSDQDGVGKALIGRLQKIGVQSLVIEDSPSREQLEGRIEGWLSEGPIQGVYWLAALDNEGALTDFDLEGFRAALHARVKLLYSTMRAVYAQIGETGTFLVSATRLGGHHGYDEAGAVAPLGGAVCGFTKTFKREKPEALVKCVDFESSRKKAALADLLIDETLQDPGVVEVGYRAGMRWSVGLSQEPAPEPREGCELDDKTVFAVTGAAGSIVSAIVADLARASGGVFHLLDLAPEPDPANADLAAFGSDREQLKRDLFERAKARGERSTPALIEKELAGLERQHAALAAMQAVQSAGGTAHYHQLNLLDAQAVAEAVDQIREGDGRIDVLLHAAGLEISHMLPDKSPREFDLVFDVKADGMFNLLKAIGAMPLGAVVAFSSITGRFGNAGQSDYGAANDLLCKIGTSLRTSRPETRAITIDWTAWGDIGMAARGSIPKMMAQAGIGMLRAEAGIPVVRRELLGGFSGEVVIAEELGILLEEWDAHGGLDPRALNGSGAGPMSDQVIGMGLHSGFTVETTLDPAAQPFLFDHRIDGTAVLPGVMGIEAFAELAKRLFVDWHVVAIEDVTFLAPFKFYRDEARKVALSAEFQLVGDELIADCELTGSRQIPAQDAPQVTTHFTARVRLSRMAQQTAALEVPGIEPAGASVPMEDIYQVYFHGPAYRVIERAWRWGDKAVGLMPSSLPANHSPQEMPTVVDPRLIELCFQTAGILEIGTTGRMGLPQRVDRVTALRDIAAAKGSRLIAIVRPSPAGNGHAAGGFDAYVADEAGNVYVSLEGYRTVEMPGGVDPHKREPLQRAMG